MLLLLFDSAEFERVVGFLDKLVTLAAWGNVEGAGILLARLFNLLLHLHYPEHLVKLLLGCTKCCSLG